jgi:molybdopterin synthase catalytic subunit
MSVRLSSRPLRLAAAYATLRDPSSGGVALFVGRVRPDRSRSGTVTGLFYEAHRAVALHQLRELDALAREKYGARRVVLWHRIGLLPVGEIAVIVGVACPHRAQALSACRVLIDRLKWEVPIWKTDRARPARPPRTRPVRRPAR